MEITSLPWEDGDPPDQAHPLMQPALLVHVAALGDESALLQMGRHDAGRWGGGDVVVMVASSSNTAQCGGSSSTTSAGGHGCEIPGTREPGDAHEVTSPDGFDAEGCPAACCSHEQQMQLDLGLTDITKFFSYSKLWRMLYFVNDAPFRIRNHGRVPAGEW